MEPLLKITHIPIAIELKVNNARLEYQHSTAELEVTRNEGGLKIRSNPIKLNIDTFEARNSISPTTRRNIAQNAEKGKQAAYEATATLAQEGQLLLNAKMGENVFAQIAKQSTHIPTDFGLGFTPTAPPEITWSDPDLTIQYQMDKLNFDWKVSGGNFEFIPGNIEILIKQRPELIIEYIGGPIYVPPSADPEYTPIDMRV